MVEAITERAETKRERGHQHGVSVFSDKSASQPQNRAILDCNKNALAQAAIDRASSHFETQLVSIEDFDKNHLIELIELASELGHDNAVDALFANTLPLQSFLTCLLKSIQSSVMKELETATGEMKESLFSTLHDNGFNVERTAFESMVKAMQNACLGGLSVGIRNHHCYDFDNAEKIYLELTTEVTELTVINSLNGELAKSLLGVVIRNSDDALLRASPEAIIDAVYDFNHIQEYAGTMLDTGTPEDVWDELVENEYLSDFGYCEATDMSEIKEDVIDQITVMQSLLCYGKKKSIDHPLVQWLQEQFTKLDWQAMDMDSHSYPMHFLTDSEEVASQLNQQYQEIAEYADSRMILTPAKAIETLVTIAKNRLAIQMYEALTWLGREDTLRESYASTHGLKKSSVVVLT
ncbi:hypothetical protein VTH8203_01537 [Vibrio thalassae]|uniref:Uncharacterized protein n=1 Tax=Vibrio thalassae TaxID=1243014 RepID=A0A240EGY5_9VIBR|nr:hypothetical protein [Vibrio thalassae]SNX47922.1 hypothetical protein VTH8203_01537 [Vibrio thalassae]